MSTDEGPAVFPVETGVDLSDLADRLFEILIDDPGGRLGRTPIVVLRRRGREPAVLTRSLLLDRHGRGRFLGWGTEAMVAVGLAPDPRGAATDGSPPRIRLAPVSIPRMLSIALTRRPRGLWRVLRLLLAGNRRGALTRFVRLFDAVSAPDYAAWAAAREAEDAARRPVRAAEAATWSRPRIFVRLEPGPAESLAATRASLAAQIFPAHRELAAGEAPEGEGALWLRLPAGCRLSPDALYHLARPFLADPSVVATYCDEDTLDRSGGPRDPIFRTAWNPEMAEDGALSPSGALIRADRLSAALDPDTADIGALLLAAADGRREAILHLPRVLLHLPEAVDRAVVRRPLLPRPSLADGERPTVSVVIPSRDQATLLAACLDGLLSRTRGVDLDVVVVDNGSVDPAVAALWASHAGDPRLQRLDRPGPFVFPRLIAAGIGAARHDTVLLLNNDVEPLEPDWLRAMVAELRRPRIGAVGALLLHADGSVQHAGVTLGAGGVARHTLAFVHPQAGEDAGRLACRREVAAVTAACLLTTRSHWAAVGGMDEQDLPVAFNDVDFCLRLRDIGLRTIWTPAAALLHLESVSRGIDDTPEKKKRLADEETVMSERWGARLANDPFHSPNLSLVGEPFVLEACPRHRGARRS